MQKTTMHHGYLSFLFLVLWAGPTMANPVIVNADVQSIIANLQGALEKYTAVVKGQVPSHALTSQTCPNTTPQNDSVALRLSQYQVCLQSVNTQSPSPTILTELTNLNQDLIQSLQGSSLDNVECPDSLSPRLSDPFDTLSKSVLCLNCWSNQVAALNK